MLTKKVYQIIDTKVNHLSSLLFKGFKTVTIFVLECHSTELEIYLCTKIGTLLFKNCQLLRHKCIHCHYDYWVCYQSFDFSEISKKFGDLKNLGHFKPAKFKKTMIFKFTVHINLVSRKLKDIK